MLLISNAEQNGAQQKRLIERGSQISEGLPTLAPDAVRSILMTVVNRVDIKAEHIEVRIYWQQLRDLLQGSRVDPLVTGTAPPSHPGHILKLKVKARLQRVGREMKLVVHNTEDRATADPGLLRIVARAHDFQERLIQDPDLTVPAIASQERLTIGYLSRLLRLPLAGTRYRHGHHQRQTSASAQRQAADAAGP